MSEFNEDNEVKMLVSSVMEFLSSEARAYIQDAYEHGKCDGARAGHDDAYGEGYADGLEKGKD